jgi:hypothetical protein
MGQYITETGLKKSFQSFLDKLKEWLPIKKQEDSVVIQAPETFKNALEIKSDGMIYIIGTNSDTIKLQERLDRVGTIVAETVDVAKTYLKSEYLGSMIYIKEGAADFVAGLYTIGIDAANHGALKLIKMGTTTSSAEDLGERVDILEDRCDNLDKFVADPLDKGEIDNICINNKNS